MVWGSTWLLYGHHGHKMLERKLDCTNKCVLYAVAKSVGSVRAVVVHIRQQYVQLECRP